MDEEKKTQNQDLENSLPENNIEEGTPVSQNAEGEQKIQVQSPEQGEPAATPIETPAEEVVGEEVAFPSIQVNTEPEQSEKDETPQVKTSSTSVQKIFMIFGIFLIVLVVIFYGLLLMNLFSGNVSNPLFLALGIQDSELQNTLFLITHSIFGSLTVIYLFSFLVRLFQGLNSSKHDVRRKLYFKKTFVSLVIILLLSSLWAYLYTVVRDARVISLDNKNMIETEPAIVQGLNAPIKVKFNIGDNLFRTIDQKQVKQINWDFDGDEKTDRSGPEVFYTFRNKGANNGKYLVKATVIYNIVNSSKDLIFEAEKEVIIANESISAEILTSRDTGPSPLAIEFNGEGSIDPDGEVILYEWDLNDDGIYEIKGPNKSKVSNVFQKMGNYKVRLRVQGANNDFDEAEKIIEVTNPERNLRARITHSQPKEGYAPYEIELTGEGSFSRRGRVIKYVWRIDAEEEVIVSRSMKWTFTKPGQYVVRLTVENDLGESDEEEIIISVAPPRKNDKVTIRTTPKKEGKTKELEGKAPFEIAFDASTSEIENAVEWQWDFQNDGIIDEYNVATKHVFREAGLYNTKLTIVDIDGDEFSNTIPIRIISPGIQAQITADPIAGVAPLVVSFDGSGSTIDKGDIINYIWEFPGQAPIPYSSQISYEFPVIGVYEVKLTVLSSDKRQDTTSKFISVRAEPLAVQFESSPKVGDAPLTVEFDSSLSTGNPSDYRWDFGDGTISRQVSPVHTYVKKGTYQVNLKITDSNGIVDVSQDVIDVR